MQQQGIEVSESGRPSQSQGNKVADAGGLASGKPQKRKRKQKRKLKPLDVGSPHSVAAVMPEA